MNLTTYQDAIAELAVPKLTAFLKAQVDIIEIEGWTKLRAPEKREQLLEGMKQSKELREQFVAFYGDESGKDADFSEWELASAEADKAGQTEPPAEAVEAEQEAAGAAQSKAEQEAPAPAVAATPAPTAFVEGAFEEIVANVAGLDAQQSKINLSEAEDRMEFEHIRIGALLTHIQSSEHYTTLGYDNMREFLAAETGMDYRKGMYLVGNYTKVRDLGIPAEALKGVTWSALRHIVPILNEKNYKKWLDAARSNTHVKLIEAVAKEKTKQAGALPTPETGGEGDDPAPITKAFNVSPEQNETIKAALEKAKGQGNVESNGAALDIIAAAYTGAPPSDTTVAAVMPDTSEDGFKAMFSKMKAEGGNEAVIPVLNAIGEVWKDVDITVAFPEAQAAE